MIRRLALNEMQLIANDGDDKDGGDESSLRDDDEWFSIGIYLHSTVAGSNGQVRGHAHVDCEYLENSNR